MLNITHFIVMFDYSLNFDISAQTIRFVEVSRQKESFMVHACGCFDFMNDQKNRLHEIVKPALSPKSPSDKRITLSLWSGTVMARRIHMPTMTQAELKSAIRYEFEKHIPFSIDDCFVDYSLIDRSAKDDRMDLLLVSAKKDFVEEHRRMIADAAWDLSFIDIHPLALSNAFGQINSKDSPKPVALIHVADTDKFRLKGPNFIVITKDGVPAIVRDLGEELTSGDGAIPEASIKKILDGVMKSVEFFENTFDEPVGSFMLSGRGAANEQMKKALNEATQSAIEPWIVSGSVEFSDSACRTKFIRDEQDYMVAMGLAFRSLTT